MRRRISYALLALASIAVCSIALAQQFPTKAVRIVVPYAAGGPVDVLARALAQKLSEVWGKPVIIDNKPGGNEIIAAQNVAASPRDG
jgi:tripartite-type tricarboxylate transporter receptor subunit TctC